jgi:tetratricopeptide (TPR) repeat protein
MVIGDNAFLTPVEVHQMRRVPELVFINCCHLGHIEGEAPDEQKHNLRRDFHKIAANVSTEFIRMGVRAVVAAGWAVDDTAATVFAKRFYEEMLEGTPFGKAVREAREAAYLAAPHINTWGAYQCYGDPDYKLGRDGENASGNGNDVIYASASEAVAAIDPKPDRERLAELVTRLDAQGLLSKPQVLAAIGRAYGQAQQFDQGIDYLRRALGADGSTMDSRDIEMLANLEAREALRLWDSTGDHDAALRLVDTGIERLESLLRVAAPDQLSKNMTLSDRSAATSERLALLGSAYKRKALMETGSTRLQLLDTSLGYYRKAYQRGRSEYPLLNALMLEVAIGWQKRDAGTGAKRQKILDEARRLGAEIETAAATRRDFWTAAMRGDAALVEALCSASFNASGLAGVHDRYREATQRASPRELDSALDQIDFLIRLADGQPAIAQALRTLRESVAPAPASCNGAGTPKPAPARKKAPRERR